jgi:hypothetical protein
MAIQTLVVPTLDNHFDRGIDCFRQLVDPTYSVDHSALGCFDRSLVAVFFGIGASNAAKNVHRNSQPKKPSLITSHQSPVTGHKLNLAITLNCTSASLNNSSRK